MATPRSLGTLLLCTACATPVTGPCPAPGGPPTTTVYLVNHGWHTGIVLDREKLKDRCCPDRDDLPQGEFLEVGWGDRVFYQTPQPGLGAVLRAALWPTSAVLHVTGLDGPVARRFPHSEVLRIRLSEAGFQGLCRFIADSFARDRHGHVRDLGPGLYGNSRFYRSAERYHLLNTCNVWVARALRAAGCPTTPALSLTAGALMSQARRLTTPPSSGAPALELGP